MRSPSDCRNQVTTHSATTRAHESRQIPNNFSLREPLGPVCCVGSSELQGSGRLQLQPHRALALCLRRVSEFHQRTFSDTEEYTPAPGTLLGQTHVYPALRIVTQSNKWHNPEKARELFTDTRLRSLPVDLEFPAATRFLIQLVTFSNPCFRTPSW